MKLKILLFFLSVVCAYAVPTGTVYKAVQVDTNGVIVKPANFIAANFIATGVVSTVETDPIFTNSVAGRITLADTNAWYTGSGGGLLDVTVSGGILVGTGAGSTRDIGLSTNALTNAAIQAGLVTASITNPLSDRVSVIDTGKVSQAQGAALTNDLRGDIADGLDFSAAPTVNGNPVLTNAPTGGTETDPVYGTGLTARLSGILGTAAYSNGTDFVHASRIGELTNETFFRIYTNNATWYGTEQVTVTPTNEFLISEGFITSYIGSRTHIVIPHEIGGYIIEGIDADVFKNNDTIVSVVFPDATYMKVNEGAFSLCDNLEFVTFNGAVDVIGISAFESCPKLVSVIFKKGTPPSDEDIYTGSTHVTNYVSTDSAGWGTTFSGRPVSIPPLSTYRLEVSNTNVMEAIAFLSNRTNSCPWEIDAPAIRTYPRGILYATNALVYIRRSTSQGHAWFQVGWQTNANSPFIPVDGSHLASTTNNDALLTNSIPPEMLLSVSVTNLGAVTSNLFINVGYQEP